MAHVLLALCGARASEAALFQGHRSQLSRAAFTIARSTSQSDCGFRHDPAVQFGAFFLPKMRMSPPIHSIRLLRRSLGLSQDSLARLAEFLRGSLSRLERGVGAQHLEDQVRTALEKLASNNQRKSVRS